MLRRQVTRPALQPGRRALACRSARTTRRRPRRTYPGSLPHLLIGSPRRVNAQSLKDRLTCGRGLPTLVGYSRASPALLRRLVPAGPPLGAPRGPSCDQGSFGEPLHPRGSPARGSVGFGRRSFGRFQEATHQAAHLRPPEGSPRSSWPRKARRAPRAIHGSVGLSGSVKSREVVYDDHQLQPLVRNYKQIMSQMSRQ